MLNHPVFFLVINLVFLQCISFTMTVEQTMEPEIRRYGRKAMVFFEGVKLQYIILF